MATSSFEKPIVVRGKKAVDMLIKGLTQPAAAEPAETAQAFTVVSKEALAKKMQRR